MDPELPARRCGSGLWKPLAAYGLFAFSAFVALLLAIAFTNGSSRDIGKLVVICVAGLVGVGVGQLVGLARLKTAPALIAAVGLIAASFGILALSDIRGGGDTLEVVLTSLAFFVMAIPCGIASLQHRYELFAAFWPAVGWIGAVLAVLEDQQRLAAWDRDKMHIWTPSTVGILSGFVVTLMIYLAAKQTMRIELWQALSGATERRISRRTTLATVPRKNLVPLLLLALLLTGIVAVLAPYLWRTGPGKGGGGDGEPDDAPKVRGPDIDGDALVRTLQQMGQATLEALKHLWPLLLLFVFYRPLKRMLLLRHLRKPLVPTPPSERIDNLWEYVRIAAEDAGVFTLPADSVEELVTRIRLSLASESAVSPSLERAAEIYTTTRYGFVVAAGAAANMQIAAETTARELRATLGWAKKFTNGWRALS